MKPPEFLEFEIDGARLGALRWAGIEGARTVVAVHGITSNAWAWDPVAHHLAGGANLLAVDLRGRGRSVGAPAPFGIRRHADDVAAVIEQLPSTDRALIVGHSMGAFVAMMVDARHPDRVDDVVLVDGGPRLPVPAGSDVDDVLQQTFGPALERLGTTWPDRVSYYTMWSQHPAFADGISVDLERNLLADLVEVEGGFRAAVNEVAVRIDGRELLSDSEVRELLDRRDAPTTIVRAPHGLTGTPPPLISDAMRGSYPQHRWIEADGTNHYTVLLGARGAAIVAEAIRDALAAG